VHKTLKVNSTREYLMSHAKSTGGQNVSHLHYDDHYYSFIINLVNDDAFNRSDFVHMSNMIGGLEQYHSSICLLRLKEL
jgi:hypothetical protein